LQAALLLLLLHHQVSHTTVAIAFIDFGFEESSFYLQLTSNL
jgi:hypothetical protein